MKQVETYFKGNKCTDQWFDINRHKVKPASIGILICNGTAKALSKIFWGLCEGEVIKLTSQH